MTQKPNEPVDARIRLAISRWPADAPRGAVSSFCYEHGISRNTFYKILTRARQESPAAALQPRSKRPKTSPRTLSGEIKQQAVDVRASLAASGLDHGPISVYEKMKALGMDTPSVASLARIFRAAGVARVEPKKRPRASYRRFVYPAPNCLWQLDATEYVLTGGGKAVIFQLIDDHSRLAVASVVATGETSEAAVEVVKKGIAAHGVPQRLLSDNGAALNPSRRGSEGQLVTYLTSLGVEAITGRPGRPTTQGKNERFHQTLFRYLDSQPMAESVAELQAQVDVFDLIYNTQRSHQGLPGRITPAAAWAATEAADPPRPVPVLDPMVPEGAPLAAGTTWEGECSRKVKKRGQVVIKKVWYQISTPLAGQRIHAVWDHAKILFVDADGVILIEHPLPSPGTTYVGNGQRSGHRPSSTGTHC